MPGPVIGGWTEDEDVNVDAEPDLPDLMGTVIEGKYRVERVLGQGGMGTVYEAVQLGIERRVAVKVINAEYAANKTFLRRFLREAIVISRLRHPNTVTLHDHGQLPDGRVFLVMERLEGKTLASVVRRHGALSLARALEIGRQLCQALSEAHDLEIVHRDLKPSNIFLTSVEGHRDWVKVLDFGIAKIVKTDSGTNLTGARLLGTPRYMAPEQIDARSTIDARADVYAIGLILYEMLVGRPVFIDPVEVSLLHKHLNEPPPPMRSVRPDLEIEPRLEALVMRCLAKSAEDRPPHARALLDELAGIETIKTPVMVDSPTISAMPEPATAAVTVAGEPGSITLSSATLPEKHGAHRAGRRAAALFLLVSCGGLLYVLFAMRRADPPPTQGTPMSKPEPAIDPPEERHPIGRAPKPAAWRILGVRVVVGDVDEREMADLRQRASRAVARCHADPPERKPVRLRLVRDRGKETITVRPIGSRAGDKLRRCVGTTALLPEVAGLAIIEMEIGS